MFAVQLEGFYWVECVNGSASFAYCPGDGAVHRCGNMPECTVYAPTGICPSSLESCRYLCADRYAFLLGGVCDFRVRFYNNNGTLKGHVRRPPTLWGRCCCCHT
ncbi:hypothetical protein TraAM80_03758 [Trypanosoma rangeli]|uniref:Uncharacterized protein n=1 Tax=Trypanosoma rangeli TaxID=5698 RepID=A0A422NMP3_TRYRA|nr:uncharacterized protein TraAM80_03758 [Trypanosoma rangeli]RNF06735.1 hypothetical protein TraAM80_03758 [Trypanosoma rangeli]|eukprot:RNF06735.1 hypothetical protein TraAM80_03758 [Trypanosoma rangeli]